MSNANVLVAYLERMTGLRLSVQQRRGLPVALAQLALEVELELASLEARLLDDPVLLERLAQSFTVPETFFGRVAAQIDALRQVVLPELNLLRSDLQALRIWCAGCSTGEEAYTLAALLEGSGLFLGWDAQVLASDLNRVSLQIAVEGRYPNRAFRAEGEAFKRFAQPEGQSWRMLERLRERVRFVQHNLLGSEWPVAAGSQDLIVCRNVSIYFSPERAFEVYARFHQALAAGGWLVLGPSDPQHGLDARGFEPVSVPGAVIWRKRAAPAKPESKPMPKLRSVRQPEDRVVPPLETPAVGIPVPAGLPESLPARQAGLQALEANDPHAALEHLRRATFLAPQDAMAHFALGRAWWLLGEVRRARTAWALAKRLWLQEPGPADETARWLQAVDQLLQHAQTSSPGGR